METVIKKIRELSESKEMTVVGIDGNCCSGKTTLAQILSQRLGTQTVHMDDFFLLPDMRTSERLCEAGGNIHYERFIDEVVAGLKSGKPFEYRIFDCRTGDYSGTKRIVPSGIIVIEGSYSLHPKFGDICDLKVFSEISQEEQLRRVKERNGEQAAAVFSEKWIPMENKYFEAFAIRDNCDILYSNEK